MNCAQIGEPGTGKTYNLLTLLPFAKQLGRPILVVDVDNKLTTNPLFIPHIAAGEIVVNSITTKQFTGTLSAAVTGMKSAPSQAPTGYYAIAAAIDTAKTNENLYSTVVLDTLTVAQEHLRQLLLYTARKAQFEFAEWGLFLSNMEKLFTAFYDINAPIKIINMHSYIEKDDTTGMLRTLPLIDGSFRNKAGMYVQEFYQCFPTAATSNKPSEYKWKTRPDGRFNARSDVFTQPEILQDWGPVWKKVLLTIPKTSPVFNAPGTADALELAQQGKPN